MQDAPPVKQCCSFLVGGFKKRDDAVLTESQKICSNGISEPKRRKVLSISFADKVISFVKIYSTNLKIGRDKVLRKNVQRMPSSSNSVGKKDLLS